MPTLFAAPKPTFSGSSTRRTAGNRSRTSAGLPSPEALSTTTTSCSPPPTASRQRSRCARALKETMTTETVSAPARPA